MADITNPEAVRFVNEVIRPLAEAFEALDANAQIAKDRYTSTFAPLVSGNAGTDAVDDGRTAEGVSRLTLADVQNFATQVNTFVAQMDQSGVRDVIRKPGVRLVKASIT